MTTRFADVRFNPVPPAVVDIRKMNFSGLLLKSSTMVMPAGQFQKLVRNLTLGSAYGLLFSFSRQDSRACHAHILDSGLLGTFRLLYRAG